MKAVKSFMDGLTAADIDAFEQTGAIRLEDQGETVVVEREDVEIVTEDIPGMLVASSEGLTVALDAELTDALRNEGLARELVNRLQNLRKQSGLAVTDRIALTIEANEQFAQQIAPFEPYICGEVLADSIEFGAAAGEELDLDGVKVSVSLHKK